MNTRTSPPPRPPPTGSTHAPVPNTNTIILTPPTFEHHPTGLGIDHPSPRISWRLTHSTRPAPTPGPTTTQEQDTPPQAAGGWTQTSYTIQITSSIPPDGDGDGDSTSHTVHRSSADSVLVPWPCAPLRPREVRYVRVCASVGLGTPGKGEEEGQMQMQMVPWTEWTRVEAGLLNARGEFVGKFIGSAAAAEGGGPVRPVRFRRGFTFEGQGGVKKARLYITAMGVYEVYLNGVRVGEEEMAPGWTSYRHRMNYQVFDVTGMVESQGMNGIAVEVGEGWWAGRLGWKGERHFWGKEVGVYVQLEVETDAGERVAVVSDERWTCALSALVQSEIYDGEVYDARLEGERDWRIPAGKEGYPNDGWGAVRVLEFPTARMVAPDAPPVRITETKPAVAIFASKSGRVIVDFGQNLVGKLFVPRLDTPAGHTVTFRHAEVMEDGELGVRPLRSAAATDSVISGGRPITNWTPKFTFHGFRYVQVDGWTPGDARNPLTLASLAAKVMHTDMQRAGWFECSEPMVNQLHANTVWSMRGNFLSIPTDCPQRDERLGWTGDIQVFGPSACFLYNVAGMLGNWLEDVSLEQAAEGGGIVPFVVPNVLQSTWGKFPQAVWDDVVILLPWAIYQATGDVELLRRQYPSMKLWLDNGVRRGPDGLWDPLVWQLGDWLDPAAPPDKPAQGRTDGTFVADAYLVHTTRLLATITRLLHLPADTTHYTTSSTRLLNAFQTKYITPLGLPTADTQTGLALTLLFALSPSPAQAAFAATRLARAVRLAQFKVSTGFAGTPAIAHALTRVGRADLAYRMLLEKGCPSWLYPVTCGATTVWERWDAMTPTPTPGGPDGDGDGDGRGRINPGEMTSFNHYALGAVVAWLHECVGGIAPLEPGWRGVVVRPVPGPVVGWAGVRHEGPYGVVGCTWAVDREGKGEGKGQGRFRMEVEVPVGARAWVVLPSGQGSVLLGEGERGVWVGSGVWTWEEDWLGGDGEGGEGWPPQGIFPERREAVWVEEGIL